MALNFSRLGGNGATFQNMIQRFGVVTVMNAEVYEGPSAALRESWKTMTAAQIMNSLVDPICKLDTLKVANAPQEGPTKTVTGGQYTNPLIKFGKTARLELQDALGNAAALDALAGTVSEVDAMASDKPDYSKVYALHVTGDYAGPKTIVGDSFFIDQESGQQVKVKIIFYQFLPESIFNLTQDAEGDATVFDMNGDLLNTEIGVHYSNGSLQSHGVFYSIVDPSLEADTPLYSINASTGVITLNSPAEGGTLDGAEITSGSTVVPADQASLLILLDSQEHEIFRTVLVR